MITAQIAIASDNVSMLKVTGTSQGRIFLAGKDGCLYELLYRADEGWFEGWFPKKVRKINHSRVP